MSFCEIDLFNDRFSGDCAHREKQQKNGLEK
jgi:hypothetical protein